MAERLHKQAAAIPSAGAGDVGAGLRMAPDSLRDDLARAVGSNGKVDAAGERSQVRTTLPASVKRLGASLTDSVQQSLLELPASDESGLQYINPPAARKLAMSAVTGQLRVSDFVCKGDAPAAGVGSAGQRVAGRAARGLARYAHGAPGGDDPVRAADSYRCGAGEAGRSGRSHGNQYPGRGQVFGGMAAEDHGLLGDTVYPFSAAGRGTPIVGRVRPAARRLHHDSHAGCGFASGASAELPGEQVCGKRDRGREEDPAGSSERRKGLNAKPRRGGERHGSQDERGSGGSDSGGDGQVEVGVKPARRCAWPDKPRLPDDKFKEFRADCHKQFPEACFAFLVGTCREGSCTKSHTVLSAFEAVKRKFR